MKRPSITSSTSPCSPLYLTSLITQFLDPPPNAPHDVDMLLSGRIHLQPSPGPGSVLPAPHSLYSVLNRSIENSRRDSRPTDQTTQTDTPHSADRTRQPEKHTSQLIVFTAETETSQEKDETFNQLFISKLFSHTWCRF